MLKKINLISIFIIIILYSIFIGSPLEDNITTINIIIIIYTIIFFIIRNKKNENKIKVISSKIDLFILLLCVSSVIPLLLNKSITITGSLNAFTRYLTIFAIYTIIKIQLKDRPKDAEYIIDAIIISGAIIFTIGIDNLTYNLFENFLTNIGTVSVMNQDYRFVSNFGYANTTAVTMVIMYILSVYKYNNEKNNKKYIYSITSFIALIGLILSYSRAVWVIFALTIVIYFIFNKDKKISIYVITGIFSIIYSIIFLNLRPKEIYLLIYIVLIIFSLLVPCILALIEKIKFKKIKRRTIIGSFIAIILITIVLYNYGLTKTEPLVLFDSVYSESKYEQVIRNIGQNETYNISFNLEAISRTNQETAFSISIIERNKYDDEITKTTKQFNNYSGNLDINITTREETTNIVLKFERLNRAASEKLVINNLNVNQEEIILKYQFLPKTLVDRIKDINLSGKSVWERLVFIEDGIKILKDNFIFGIGRRWI